MFVGCQLGDFYEFCIIEYGFVFVIIYDLVVNFLCYGGLFNGWLFDSMFQEIDIVIDEFLFEWCVFEYFLIYESYQFMFG